MNDAYRARARRLRPGFVIPLKHNSPTSPVVKSMLHSTSPNRRLRPTPHVCLEFVQGKLVAVPVSKPTSKTRFQVVGSDGCAARLGSALTPGSACQCHECAPQPLKLF
jgi:hypothetical protein